MSQNKKSFTYAEAGVSLAAWGRAKQRIGALVADTFDKNVIGGFGHFGGLYDVSILKKYQAPVLVSSTDGVGTKLMIAQEMNMHEGVGADILNHCVNDILVLGAQPLFFLDYYACGALDAAVLEQVVGGLSRACKEAECVLIGGETAEMPSMYAPGEYDLAGTIVGVVEKGDIVDGSAVRNGDIVIGLRSNGLHTNGYSLARTILREAARKTYNDIFDATGETFGSELLRVHRSYRAILPLLRSGVVKGCVHITGGGFQENVDRVLPAGCSAVIDTKRWNPDPIFAYLQKHGGVARDEMYRTFNMGIGMVLIVKQQETETVLAYAAAQPFEPVVIGRIVDGNQTVHMEY